MSGAVIRFCLAGAVLAAGVLFGAAPGDAATNPSPWLRLSWSSDDGLPNNTVGGLVQTPDGFLWLATPNGLARFDGLEFEPLPSTNFIAPPNRGIIAMVPARAGGAHLGMDRGAVVSLRSGKTEVFLPDAALSQAMIYSLTEDSSGAIWVCYRDGTVGRLENGKMRRFTEADGLRGGNFFCSLVCDAKGRLWFAKNGQFGFWSEGKFQTLKSLPEGAVQLGCARDGGIWICVESQLLKYTQRGALEDHGSFRRRQSRGEPTLVHEARDGAVWIGTSFRGLFRYDNRAFEPVPTTHPEILSLLEDAEGTVWVGTGGGGLNQVRVRAVTLLTAEEGLQFDGALSLCEDRQGVVWAALRNGSLARLADGRWRVVPTDSDWGADAACVCADPSGGIWVGTRLHGLQRWRDGAFVVWGDLSQVKGQSIHTLLVASNGDLWLGENAPGVVQRLRQGKMDTFALPEDVRVVRACAEDAAGRVWFGTSKGVLLRVEGDHLVDETARTTGEPQSIRSLFASPDGSLWIAYAGWGLGRLKEGKFAAITAREGLYDDFVAQIIPDDGGWFWFGANRGVFKARKEELDGAAEGRLSRVRSVHYGPGDYDQGDSPPSLQANFGNSPLSLRSRDGRLWLPMRTGLLLVDPQKLRESTQPPKVLVTRVKLGEKVVAAYGGLVPHSGEPHALLELAGRGRELAVPPDHRRLEFDFTALSFVGAENNSFRYQLEGMDEEWVDSSLRTAVYPRLPAGHYRFRLMGCNSEGVWNEEGVSLAFVVSPFFWQTWWFRLGVVALFTATVIAVVRYVSFRRLRLQVRQLEAQADLHRERARIAKDIHDDVGASLTQISLMGELAREDLTLPGGVSQLIARMSETARAAVKSLDEIVWAVNPRNDTLAHFIDYTGQYALDSLRLSGIRCRLDLPEHPPSRELSTDVRHNLFLSVKEAINNCIKHSRATELRLKIDSSDEKLEILLEDNGRGFEGPAPEDGVSDGLRNMQQRLAGLGGQCCIQSQPAAGVRIAFDLPWAALRHS